MLLHLICDRIFLMKYNTALLSFLCFIHHTTTCYSVFIEPTTSTVSQACLEHELFACDHNKDIELLSQVKNHDDINVCFQALLIRAINARNSDHDFDKDCYYNTLRDAAAQLTGVTLPNQLELITCIELAQNKESGYTNKDILDSLQTYLTGGQEKILSSN